MPEHRTATREEWGVARNALLEREKAYTRLGDELAAARRELPWVEVEKPYTLQTEAGHRTLPELFDGRSQLLVYHFMFGPDWAAGCPACSATADGFDALLAHLAARDVTIICVSHAPVEKLLAYGQRMGWRFLWASSFDSDFNLDYGVSVSAGAAPDPGPAMLTASELAIGRAPDGQPGLRDRLPQVARRNASTSGTTLPGYFTEGHGFSSFVRAKDAVYHCYSSYARGTEFLMGFYPILDRTPMGRAEGEAPMDWVRRHDEYERCGDERSET